MVQREWSGKLVLAATFVLVFVLVLVLVSPKSVKIEITELGIHLQSVLKLFFSLWHKGVEVLTVWQLPPPL